MRNIKPAASGARGNFYLPARAKAFPVLGRTSALKVMGIAFAVPTLSLLPPSVILEIAVEMEFEKSLRTR